MVKSDGAFSSEGGGSVGLLTSVRSGASAGRRAMWQSRLDRCVGNAAVSKGYIAPEGSQAS
jgi:hypothetical protein